ncbi:unnamed protein product [Trichobilharzia regenti]|nr:unnamed protein product [Trichobilharzia regenti]
MTYYDEWFESQLYKVTFSAHSDMHLRCESRLSFLSLQKPNAFFSIFFNIQHEFLKWKSKGIRNEMRFLGEKFEYDITFQNSEITDIILA